MDRVPDHLLLHVLNLVSDVRSLARCRAVSCRFASLVPQVDCLLLSVDAVVSPHSDPQFLPLLHRFLSSLLHSFFSLLLLSYSPKAPFALPCRAPDRSPSSPADLLRGFDAVRKLEVKLPGGDLKLAEKGAVLRWRATFGRMLRSCVILAARRMTAGNGGAGGEEGDEREEGLKERVIWTIGALIASSARHHMLRDVVKGRCGEGMEELIVRDRDGEGVLVMDREGVEEWRRGGGGDGTEEEEGRKGRTVVPAVRMRMWDVRRLELGSGIVLEEAVLVVARAAERGGTAVGDEKEQADGLTASVREAFQGVFGCAAEQLLKSPCYVLEMNSF